MVRLPDIETTPSVTAYPVTGGLVFLSEGHMDNILNHTPTAEIIDDMTASEKDICICASALANGIMTYSGGSVLERIESNTKIIHTGIAELARRIEEGR